MTFAWVIGSGGLLGTALCNALRNVGTEVFNPGIRFLWGDQQTLQTQMATSVKAFAAKVHSAEKWEIFWAAGIGAMGSTESSLQTETETLSQLLQLLSAEPQLMARPGTVSFASSAGAIYAGSGDIINTENTPPSPTTPYAHEKLKQENLLRFFAQTNQQTTVSIARISTIYGPGQATGKQQGLLTHIARRILCNQPIHIYVPFDTIRDYIAVDDAAVAMVRSATFSRIHLGIQTKIIASETPTTIAEIISVFRRVARRPPLIITSANRMSDLYLRRIQFRSVVDSSDNPPTVRSLAVGIAQLMAKERLSFVSNFKQVGM